MPRPGHAEVALITGFPSCYARRLVDHVLAQGDFVYLVVAPARKMEAAAALATMEAHAGRTRVLEGDPSAMDLGLSGAEFREVTREIDLIHHAAFTHHQGLDDAAATLANVVTAAEIVELARASRSLRCLVFHSTTLVVGDRTGVVYETEPLARLGFRDNIEKTRLRAELVARGAMKDVPIAIVRPSHVVGASDPSEQADTLHLATLLALATPAEITLPLPHKGDTPVHAVPMDFTARASHAIGRSSGVAGKTFHLVDPQPLSARRFFELVLRAAGTHAAGAHSPGALLRTPGIENVVRHPKAFLEKLASPVRFDATLTTRVLAGTGIACPPIETYIDHLLTEAIEHLRRHRDVSSFTSFPHTEAGDPLG